MPDRRLHALLAILAVTAGATDAISFLGLGGVFSSVMTANMVLLGLSAGKHNGPLALHAGVALAGFIAGALAASRVAAPPAAPADRVTSPVLAVLIGEGMVLTGVAFGWEAAGAHPGGPAQFALLGGAAAAMGVQSAAVRALAIPGISTTYMTGLLVRELGDVAGGPGTAVSRLPLLAALIGGAIASGITYALAPRLAPLIFLAPLACAIAIAASTWSRTAGDPPQSGGRAS
jgi:uncharacterized membrane protein YoaK (UPF0700 family)